MINNHLKERDFTLFDRNVSFGMRITIGARFSVDKALPPFVDSVLDGRIVGFVKDEDIDFVFPFCPFTREKLVLSKKVIVIYSFNIYSN
jgi:hypothetical protein